jgi:hypothetical protein
MPPGAGKGKTVLRLGYRLYVLTYRCPDAAAETGCNMEYASFHGY